MRVSGSKHPLTAPSSYRTAPSTYNEAHTNRVTPSSECSGLTQYLHIPLTSHLGTSSTGIEYGNNEASLRQRGRSELPPDSSPASPSRRPAPPYSSSLLTVPLRHQRVSASSPRGAWRALRPFESHRKGKSPSRLTWLLDRSTSVSRFRIAHQKRRRPTRRWWMRLTLTSRSQLIGAQRAPPHAMLSR